MIVKNVDSCNADEMRTRLQIVTQMVAADHFDKNVDNVTENQMDVNNYSSTFVGKFILIRKTLHNCFMETK